MSIVRRDNGCGCKRENDKTQTTTNIDCFLIVVHVSWNGVWLLFTHHLLLPQTTPSKSTVRDQHFLFSDIGGVLPWKHAVFKCCRLVDRKLPMHASSVLSVPYICDSGKCRVFAASIWSFISLHVACWTFLGWMWRRTATFGFNNHQ